MPVDTIPEGAATVVDQVLGKMSTVDMFAGEPVLMQQLVTPDIVTQQVALSIPQGKIVTAVPTESKLISNRLVRPGDTIDLLATTELEVIREQGSGPLAVSIAFCKIWKSHAIILLIRLSRMAHRGYSVKKRVASLRRPTSGDNRCC